MSAATLPAVSVILPIYGVEKFLPACLASLQAQTFTDYELILVDDGSPDESGRICDEWAETHPNARVIHQQNQGLSGARNTGIAAARGQYLAFVDSDDLVRPTFLQILYELCEQNHADMALCGVEDVAENGAALPQPVFSLPQPGCYSGQALLEQFYSAGAQSYTVAWNKLYRRELWHTLRYPPGKLHEDDAVAHRLFFAAETVCCSAEPLYCYRLRQGSICRTEVRPAHFDGVDALLDRFHFYRENALPTEPTSRACWRQYLYLCGQAAQCPSEALAGRIAALQPALAGVPKAGLSLAERLSAEKWQRLAPRKLLKL